MNSWDPNQENQPKMFHDGAAQNGGIQFQNHQNNIPADGVGPIYNNNPL